MKRAAECEVEGDKATNKETKTASTENGVETPQAEEIAALMARTAPCFRPFVQEVMYTERQIRVRAAEMAKTVSDHYRGILKDDETLIVVGLLNGAIPFMTEFVSHLTIPTILDYIAVHSYDGIDTTNTVNFRSDMKEDPKNQHVLIVDDICDTGATLKWAKEHMLKKEPASLTTCVMLDKKERRVAEVDPEWSGWVIPNKFVVGFGLDFNQKYRDIPFVAVLAPAAYKNTDS
mmetsp:Transcript_10121/g.24031  ORF Transcript_10121/g.24031 Transcript_10121/m.24031 type:complete len:233 (+) Transcript_10121:86-784(+)|eukprot:3004529-Rhodomonas_salina.1